MSHTGQGLGLLAQRLNGLRRVVKRLDVVVPTRKMDRFKGAVAGYQWQTAAGASVGCGCGEP